ncbi:hypothetical protein Acr_26g0010140 [Actinidia rufa]|uniref:Late embryogenesis abundant (LEA) hydroxyproline-rich glycoprotein family n=1 Tax=Actinidia rufa TaxID=165716 RepID=A0A7J0H4Q9_9ERIC|nr:hypothetical protein Acr_26g0010140 [Actinidia rufa]
MAVPQPTDPNSYYTTSQNQASYTGHHPPPPIYNRNPPFIRRLILALVLIFFIITAVSLVSWLVLHPHAPAVVLTMLSVSNFTLSNARCTGKYEVEFTLTNPNRKIDLEFERFEVFLAYKRDRFLKEDVDGVLHFTLVRMKQTRVHVALATETSSVHTMKKWTAMEMGREWKTTRVVSFDVRMQAVARFKASGWLSRHKDIDVVCSNLKVGFDSDNNMRGKLMGAGTRVCSANIL